MIDSLVEHFDVPATLREIAGAPGTAGAEGRSLLDHADTEVPVPRPVSISENWGFASFETDRYKVVVDEDAVSPCQLFDLHEKTPRRTTTSLGSQGPRTS